ncbi:MAG: hypothetical protein RQ866_07655 [Bacteroidales bacterium]|nr:hypothetical protein [Bacteroidales bacterium]
MAATRRLTAIDLMEYSTLSEEEVCEKNAPILDLSEMGVLIQFIDNFHQVLNFLPGSYENL